VQELNECQHHLSRDGKYRTAGDQSQNLDFWAPDTATRQRLQRRKFDALGAVPGGGWAGRTVCG
jgi:hypothetical protein